MALLAQHPAGVASSGAADESPHERLLALAPETSALVLGAPGSGKTRLLRRFVRSRLAAGLQPDEILVLAPGRRSAARLRDDLTVELGVTTAGAWARTPQSLAFSVLRAEAASRGLPAPLLLTGSEQDAIIAELLEGDRESGVIPWPDSLPPAARALRGFRTELREFLMRCTEQGVEPARLRALAESERRPEWAALAHFFDQYDEVTTAFRDRHLDSVQLLLSAAAAVQRAAPEERTRLLPRLLVVDDAGELTRASVAFLRTCAHAGISVVAFGDPDAVTGSFRGARPELLAALPRQLGVSMPVFVLDGVHRHGTRIRDLIIQFSGRIGAAGAGLQRAARSCSTDEGRVRAVVADSPAEEAGIIARRLREAHVLEGKPWSEMVVVVRSGGLVPELARSLRALDVPVSTSVAARPLREHDAVRALALALEGATGRRPWGPADVVELLTGPLGGMDSVGLRRLRARLRHEELAGGGSRPAEELLVEAFRDPARLATMQQRGQERARNLAASIVAAAADHRRGDDVEQVLWGLWERSGLATAWLHRSRQGGIVGEEADEALDAVVALFSAARRFAERFPSGSAWTFLETLLDAEVPEDTIAPRGRADAVSVVTPAAVIGEEFDLVVVSRLQEGVWPDLRIRNTLLGVDAIVSAAEGEPAPTDRESRTRVLHDETRMLVASLSRARRELLVTAVSDDETSPSPYFRLLPDPSDELARADPLDLRGLTARLRRRLAESLTRTGEDARGGLAATECAAALRRLADAGVEGAAPEDWHGVAAPVVPGPPGGPAPRAGDHAVNADEAVTPAGPSPEVDEEQLRLSPSGVRRYETCPLDWVISTWGASPGGIPSTVGTILHEAMEVATEPTVEALWEVVEGRWPALPFESAWQSDLEKAKARDMVARLADYLRAFRASGGVVLATEEPFEVDLGEPSRALLRGTVDRIEQDGEGRVVIVDLKTGASAAGTDARVADDPQLGAYQLALAEGSFAAVPVDAISGGAKLLVVGGKRGKAAEAAQPPLGEEGRHALRGRLSAVATGMGGEAFAARISEHCHDLWSFGSCRIHVVGGVAE